MAKSGVSYAHRGKALEMAVEHANAVYAIQRLATVQKIATPTKVLSDRKGGVKVIRLRSTVDYIGVWNGRALAFDAKQNRKPNLFPLDGVHEHQVKFMTDWEAAGGSGFLLVLQEVDQVVYLVPALVLGAYWHDWRQGTGRASPPMNFASFPGFAQAAAAHWITWPPWRAG